MSKIVLLGSNGFVGSYFKSLIETTDNELISITRKQCNLLNKDKLYKILKSTYCNYIINCAGYTGKPNVDACENNKEACWQGNVTLPKYLSEICSGLNLKYIQVSSGCIYSGTKGKNGFRETDEANFSFDHQPCSYYSGTKAIMEDLLKKDPNVYLCRLRIPFNNISNSKNYITKLINYETLLNAQNSLSNINDFVNACYFLMMEKCDTGIYNITNTGSISTKNTRQCLLVHSGCAFDATRKVAS